MAKPTIVDGAPVVLPDGLPAIALRAFDIPGAAWWLVGNGRLHVVDQAGAIWTAPSTGTCQPVSGKCTATGWTIGDVSA